MNMNKSDQRKIMAPSAVVSEENLASVAAFLLMLVATLIKVPFYPVPFTLQTLVLPLLCFFLPRKSILKGLALFALYRTIQSGFGIMLTIGYIAGFFLMAYMLTSKTGERSFFKVLVKILTSQLIVLISGTCVLALSMGVRKAFVCGFLFFLPAEILKAVIIMGAYKLFPLRFKNSPTER
jgi:biotin transport system substrate-specific component